MGGLDSATCRGRRRALGFFGLAAMLGGVATVFGASPAQAKSSQAAVAYRGAPNGRQRCANCSWFEAPAGCGVVRGTVSAKGWCNLWG